MSAQSRKSENNIHSQFIDRWSPRAFTGESISRQELLTIMEAGAWAPSAYNIQPWRFIYALRDTPEWAPLFATLMTFNQSWAERAAALVLIASAEFSQAPGATSPTLNGTHEFDAGAAWGYIAMQTHLLGWHAHGVSGFDKELARISLDIPADFSLHAIAVIGRRNKDKSVLSASMQSREFASPRVPLSTVATEGKFTFAKS